ncbi:MAG: (deoxy)nucleoside triphosphate pyrophosphohydrolase [Caulobacterales bacterium]
MTDKSASGRSLLLVSAAALIDPEGRVLIAQRPADKSLGGLWEFPGGKVEPGESPETALIRELKEELDVTVSADALEPFAFASHAYASFHLLMPLYLVTAWRGVPRAVEAQALAWAKPNALSAYPMPPADKPLLDRLITHLGARA